MDKETKFMIISAIVFFGYFALIGIAIWITESPWPLAIMFFAHPNIKYDDNDKDKGNDITIG